MLVTVCGNGGGRSERAATELRSRLELGSIPVRGDVSLVAIDRARKMSMAETLFILNDASYGLAARLVAPVEPLLTRLHASGAAFLAIAVDKPESRP